MDEQEVEEFAEYQEKVKDDILIGLTTWTAGKVLEMVGAKEPHEVLVLCQEAYLSGSSDTLAALMQNMLE